MNIFQVDRNTALVQTAPLVHRAVPLQSHSTSHQVLTLLLHLQSFLKLIKFIVVLAFRAPNPNSTVLQFTTI